MRMRRAGVIRNGSGAGRRGGPRRGRGGEDAGWRSHTFSDGVYAITLTTALDVQTADRLRGRLRELCVRGCDRLIVDVRAAVQPGTRAPELLAAVFQTPMSDCEVVVVMPRGSSPDGLSSGVAVAWSLDDARELLVARPVQEQLEPARAIGAADRHELAVRQALRWAAQTAGAGDYESALRGLATIERVEGTLPEGWQALRKAWLAASRDQGMAMGPVPRGRAGYSPSRMPR
jgi:hypothetical protein